MPEPLSVQHYNALTLPYGSLTFLNFGDHVNLIAEVYSGKTKTPYFLAQLSEMPPRGLTPSTAHFEKPLFEHLWGEYLIAECLLLDKDVELSLYQKEGSTHVLVKKPFRSLRVLSHSYSKDWSISEIFRDVERHYI